MERDFFAFSNLLKYSEIIHGISNRHYGDMRFGKIAENETVKNRKNFLRELNIDIEDVVVPRLIHDTKIVTVSKEDKGKGSQKHETAFSSTDGLITKENNLYLMTTAADCLPIFIYDPMMKICGNIHAGWRGIAGQIVTKAIEKFIVFGSDTKNIIVGIGPSICQKHFVVKGDVLEPFLEYYPAATFVRNNHGYVDLKKAVVIDLKKYGIPQANIEIAPYCTICDNGFYGSFRKEKDSAPALAAVIGMRNLKN